MKYQPCFNPGLTVMAALIFILLVQSAWAQIVHRAPAKCVTKSGTNCIFPFTYEDTKYYECTYADSKEPWCATSVDPGGKVVTNKWEDCKVSTCPVEEKPDCVTVGGPDEGSPCVFPFTVGEETFTECHTGRLETGCITVTYWGILTVTSCKYEGSDEVPWCSTATTSTGTHIKDGGHWGECPASCNAPCIATDGPGEGEPCILPFLWQGLNYTHCEPWVYGGQWETDGELWCSTKVDTEGNHIEGNYGICSDDCPVDVSVFARGKSMTNTQGSTISP